MCIAIVISLTASRPISPTQQTDICSIDMEKRCSSAFPLPIESSCVLSQNLWIKFFHTFFTCMFEYILTKSRKNVTIIMAIFSLRSIHSIYCFFYSHFWLNPYTNHSNSHTIKIKASHFVLIRFVVVVVVIAFLSISFVFHSIV